MSIDNADKRIFAIVIVAIVLLFAIKSGAYECIDEVVDYLKEDASKLSGLENISFIDQDNDFADQVWKKSDLLNFNGTLSRILKIRDLYSDKNIYVTDSGYIVSLYPKTSTDYEFHAIIRFNDFLQEHGIKLMYVNEPTKYIDDQFIVRQFGKETWINRNTDLLLRRIRAENIPCIDLRESIKQDHIDVQTMFYRTDHHWTTRSGLWAAGIIADGLNEYCGYRIDTSIFDEDKYEMKVWNNCWLGEQGRIVGKSYVGLDDYTSVRPNFETSYFLKEYESFHKGTFDDFIDEKVYNRKNDVYKNTPWHYSYSWPSYIINNNVSEGKVLVLGDSFEHVVVPFLSLGVHEIDGLILRDYESDFNLHDYIINNGYDTVIISYAEFMIGAHDDITNANYGMFAFE